MKKLVSLTMITLVSFWVAGASAAADDATDAKPEKPKKHSENVNKPSGARDRMKQMEAELKLSDEQKEKLKPILREQNEKIKALRDSASGDDRRAKVQDIRQATTAQVKAVLTPDQFVKWEQMQKASRPGKAKAKQQ